MNLSPPLNVRVIVDCDDCPVKELIERAAARHGVRVIMTTATATRDRGPDAVDNWIVEHCLPEDLVGTRDIPLATAGIERGAHWHPYTGSPASYEGRSKTAPGGVLMA